MARILVLGAGVLGTTVAIVMRLAGHTVQVVAEKRLGDSGAQRDPTFASAYPAASVIPHSVASENLVDLWNGSDRIFADLSKTPQTGVRIQRHFEIFEGGQPLPAYAGLLRNLTEHCSDSDTIPIRRTGATSVSAISFDCFFCDMPIYGKWLRSLADRLDIVTQAKKISINWLSSLRGFDLIINCLGAGASSIYSDLGPGYFYRGILLLCPQPTQSSAKVSYNYTPSFSIYPGFNGRASDVYFYPRSTHCVLGGTRQPGMLDRVTGAFTPAETLQCETILIDGVDVPRPIIDLNRDLINQLTGLSLTGPFRPLIGYRYVDGTAASPKITIEIKERPGMPLHIDCIGFGGAGVALSWGAALRVLRFVEALSNSDLLPQEDNHLANKLAAYLRESTA